MGRTGIYVEITIRAEIDVVWELTQNPLLHPRWDARFSSIRPVAQLDSGGYRFDYALSLPLHTIRGTGTSLGERVRPDGTRTSALRFTTTDRLSPLGDGRGYWRYLPGTGMANSTSPQNNNSATALGDATTASSVAADPGAGSSPAAAPSAQSTVFLTGYDYEPGWGSLLDRLILRRLIGWLTAWSFDRLRIWAESGIEPERWPLVSVLWFWKADRPRARNCRRQPRRARAMDDAPATLATLEAP